MSRAHMLAVGAVAADVLAHLIKMFLCLAAMADHRTALAAGAPVGGRDA